MKDHYVVLVTGSRRTVSCPSVITDLSSLDVVEGKPIMVVHGGANGIDSIADRWARANHVPVGCITADWIRDGKAAGPLRNRRLLDVFNPDYVLAYPDEASKGTWDMVRQARAAGVPLIVTHIDSRGRRRNVDQSQIPAFQEDPKP